MTFRLNYSIIYVSDMQDAVSFYRDTLGLPLKFESPMWTEFATEGATLALHATEDEATMENYGVNPAGRCRAGFAVPDLSSYHQTLAERGVKCLQEPRNVFGALLAEYQAPDGMVITIAEQRD